MKHWWQSTALGLLLCAHVIPAHADTMDKYALIAKSIPAARLKPNTKSQAWARSAASILEVTHESVAQTIVAMERAAHNAHRPQLFCMPRNEHLTTAFIGNVLRQNLQHLSEIDRHRTISEVAIAWLQQHYPCDSATTNLSAVAPPQEATQRLAFRQWQGNPN